MIHVGVRQRFGHMIVIRSCECWSNNNNINNNNNHNNNNNNTCIAYLLECQPRSDKTK